MQSDAGVPSASAIHVSRADATCAVWHCQDSDRIVKHLKHAASNSQAIGVLYKWSVQNPAAREAHSQKMQAREHVYRCCKPSTAASAALSSASSMVVASDPRKLRPPSPP